MDVCEDLARGVAWQAGVSSPAILAGRSPATLHRYRRKSQAIAPASRILVPVAWVAMRVGLAFIPWSALAWLFVAN